ncbi:MAG: hypothetical protein ACHQC8_04705 [Solirubrobacterales bacterium]
MTRRCTIVLTLVLMAALSAAAPDAAPAGSLLSGYGGPGQGNQAILGSALLNGPGGGGGGGSAGTSGLSSTGVSNAGAQAPQGGATSPRSAAGARATTSGGPNKRTTDGGQRSQAGFEETSGRASSAYPASERGGSALPSETLGLSGEDLLYILFALGALAFTGVLTRGLTPTMTQTGRHGS